MDRNLCNQIAAMWNGAAAQETAAADTMPLFTGEAAAAAAGCQRRAKLAREAATAWTAVAGGDDDALVAAQAATEAAQAIW